MTLSEIISLNRKVGADETPTRWRKQTVKGGGLDSVGKHLTRITNQLGNRDKLPQSKENMSRSITLPNLRIT